MLKWRKTSISRKVESDYEECIPDSESEPRPRVKDLVKKFASNVDEVRMRFPKLNKNSSVNSDYDEIPSLSRADRQCAIWLLDAKVLDDQHPAAHPSCSTIEFASSLRDGVLLCKLLNILLPNCINMDKIHHQTIMSQFFCLKTIGTFLEKCQNHFNFTPSQLFEAKELYFLSGFSKVLTTLSRLSHSKRALKLDIRPFPAKKCLEESDLSAEEEEVYSFLYYQINEQENIYEDMGGEYGTLYETLPPKIYDCVIERKCSALEQDAWSTFVPKTKVEYCIQELLNTEHNYLTRVLKILVDNYVKVLGLYMDSNLFKQIFANIEDIRELHENFYRRLKRSVMKYLGMAVTTGSKSPLTIPSIAEVFLQHADNFVIYGFYCKTLAEARNIIAKHEKEDTQLWKNIQGITEELKDKTPFKDLIILPFQRITKYSLLLQELAKSMPTDKKPIEDAAAAMKDITEYINEMTRDEETVNLIEDIEKSINVLSLFLPEGTTLSDYGRLRSDMDVWVTEITASEEKAEKSMYMFLFDKVLIFCTANKNNTFTYEGNYLIKELSLDESTLEIPFTVFTTSERTLDLIRDSQSSTSDKRQVEAISLQFKNLQQRNNWKKIFEDTKERSHPSTTLKDKGHKVHYRNLGNNSTTRVFRCMVCKKLLKGLLYQGYKCDLCEGVMHVECVGVEECPRRLLRTSLSDLTLLDPNHRATVTDESTQYIFRHKRTAKKNWIRCAQTPNTLSVASMEMIEMLPVTSGTNSLSCSSTHWYAGIKNRATADRMLRNLENGTFLIRYSQNNQYYVLSLSYENAVRHAVVNKNAEGTVYLDDDISFSNLQDLVDYYRENCLSNIFREIRTTLQTPIYKVIPKT